MKNILKTIALFLVVSIGLLHAGGTDNTGFSYLKVGVDARAAAMGDAFTSLADNAGAAFWNPAGLAAAGSNTLLLMHNAWLQDVNHDYAAVQFVQGVHNLAVSINMMNVTGIELRGESASEIPDGEIHALNSYIGLAYATTVWSDWQIGVQAKYLYEKYYLYSADGVALDIGLRKSNLLPGLNWGLAIHNMGKMSTLKETATPLPLLFKTGFNYTLPAKLLDGPVLLATDLSYVRDGVTTLHLGGEWGMTDYADLRVGYVLGRESQSISGGFGIAYGIFNFAYAFIPFNYDLGNSHRFSLLVDL